MSEIFEAFGKQLGSIGPIGIFACVLFGMWLRWGPGGKNGSTVVTQNGVDTVAAAVKEAFTDLHQNVHDTAQCANRMEGKQEQELTILRDISTNQVRIVESLERMERGTMRRRG